MSANDTAAVPTVKLPKAVMRQSEKVNELIKERMQAKVESSDIAPEEPVTPTEETQTDSPAEPVTTPEAPPVEVVADKTKTVEYWEHRFKTSQGMFEAEKTRLRQQNEGLLNKLSGFEEKFREMEQRLRAAEHQAPTKVDLKKYLTDEQIETYGPDVLESIMKVASSAAQDATERRIKEEIDRHVGPMQQELENSRATEHAKREETFWDTLDQRVPDWAIINDEPAWRDWLKARDPLSGYQRQQLLAQAQNAFDHERVVALFEAFKQSSPAPKSTQQNRVVPDPVGQTQIVTQQIPDTPVVTRGDIKRFYDDCKLGRYKYRPQEKDAMEKKIRQAMLAGTVR